jgi:hypothetical protein
MQLQLGTQTLQRMTQSRLKVTWLEQQRLCLVWVPVLDLAWLEGRKILLDASFGRKCRKKGTSIDYRYRRCTIFGSISPPRMKYRFEVTLPMRTRFSKRGMNARNQVDLRMALERFHAT